MRLIKSRRKKIFIENYRKKSREEGEAKKTSTIINRLLESFTSKAIFHTPEWISKNVRKL